MARSCPTAGGEVKGLERGGGRIEGAWKEGRGRRREGLGEAKKGRGKRKGEWCAAIIATRWRLIATCSGLVCLFTPSFGLIRRRRGGGGKWEEQVVAVGNSFQDSCVALRGRRVIMLVLPLPYVISQKHAFSFCISLACLRRR